jgi:uncharacterized RDD family membrane protein YckC
MWLLIGILLLLWFFGLLGDIAGSLIHLLLVIALVVFIYNQVTGRKKV